MSSPSAPAVLLCIDKLARAGTQTHIANLARGLAARGRWRPVVVGILEGGPMGRDLVAEGIAVYDLGAARRSLWISALDRYLGAAEALARVAAVEGAAVIHGHLIYANTVSAIAGLLSGVPVVAGERNAVAWKEPEAALRRRFIAASCGLLVANCRASARRAVTVGRFPPERVKVVPNGIALDRLAEPLRALDGDGLVVGAVANLTHVKGLDVLVEAAARVCARVPGVRFALVGEGEERLSLERRIAELGLRDRVRLLGSRADAARLAAGFDVAVLASRSEALPNALLEYLAAGRPVAASRVGGIPEVVEHGRHALLVRPEDPAALAAAIERLLTDRALAARLGGEGRALVRSHYGLDLMAERYEAVLDQVAGRVAGLARVGPPLCMEVSREDLACKAA